MYEYAAQLLVIRDAHAMIDEAQLIRAVTKLEPRWQELDGYSAPLPPQAVRALELASELQLQR
jgi:hypothetical protein